MKKFLLSLFLSFVLLGEAEAANRFWVGGTGTWDASDTTHWSASTGGAGGASVPTSADAVFFDGASGGGVVTVNTTVNVQAITCGAFTGTLDFSANNNNVTLTTATGMACGGTGTRTINLGNGTWTITANSGSPWNFGTTTGLTFNANGSTIVLTGTASNTSSVGFSGGSLTYNAVQFLNNTQINITGANTFASMTVTGQNVLFIPNASAQAIATLVATGTAADPVTFISTSSSAAATINSSTSVTCTWCVFRWMTFAGAGSFTTSNSIDAGANTGITINPPSASGGGGGIIGGG